jgi:hypothetical protein
VLPGSPRILARATFVALSLMAGAATVVGAMEVTLAPPAEHQASLWCEVRLHHVLEPRVRASLARGMPATLELHAELWRRRSGWFDRLENGFDASLRIRYEVWDHAYRIERAGALPLEIGSLDSVAVVLERPFVFPVGRSERLSMGARYYVVVTATLRPLSIEDVEEVEGWLSGEVADKGHAGIGVLAGLPRSAFDAVRNFAGFGDQRARAQTGDVIPRPAP